MTVVDRLRRLLPALWAGFMLCIALVAAPTAFAVLSRADAGKVVFRIFELDAYASIALGVLLLVLERWQARRRVAAEGGRQFTAGMILVLLAVFCTVLGYFAVQPMMPGARTGHGPLSFGQLHAVSVVFFAAKGLAVLALAWLGTAPATASGAAVSRPASS